MPLVFAEVSVNIGHSLLFILTLPSLTRYLFYYCSTFLSLDFYANMVSSFWKIRHHKAKRDYNPFCEFKISIASVVIVALALLHYFVSNIVRFYCSASHLGQTPIGFTKLAYLGLKVKAVLAETQPNMNMLTYPRPARATINDSWKTITCRHFYCTVAQRNPLAFVIGKVCSNCNKGNHTLLH